MRRWWVTNRPDPASRPLLGDRIELMSATDRRTHYATDVAYGEALAARTGAVPAVCGHTITLCALVAPLGPLCRCCVEEP